MKTSTDTKSPKAKKPKGPIRWEAVIPAAVLTALIGAYFSLFFDGHLRRALEYVGTQVNGAEVNIGRLSTSFLGAKLEIDNIQVTDKNKPERNIVQVGEVRFKMLWDALLRAKVVVDEAKILNIQALSPRKTPGYVVPPPPPGDKGPSLIEKAQGQVLAQTRKQFNDNFLGDVAAVLGGVNPEDQLKNLQAELKSDVRIKELQKELKDKQAKWEQRLKELPQADDLKQFETRIKALKFDTKDPAQLAKDLKEADKIIKEANEKVRLVDQTSKDVKGDVANYTQAFKDLERMIQEDVRDLQKRLKLPSLDPKEFSQQLFTQFVESKIVGVRKYVEVAREYMPPKRTAEEKQARKAEQLVPPKRGDRKTYRFPVSTGYPLFWLKHAAISSELGQSELSGNLKGEIKDLNTDPAFLGKPTLILAQGDFPKVGVSGFDAKITIDHTTEVAKESAVIKVGGFPLKDMKLSNSPDVTLALAGANGTSVLTATLMNKEITMDFEGKFQDVKFDLQAKNKHVHEIISAILNGIPVITLNAGVRGSFDDFAMNINSNLGQELAAGFQRQLQAKIAEAQARLRKLIDEKVGQERDKLKAEMDKVVGNLTKNLDSKKAEVDKVVADAKNQAEGGKGKGGTKKLEEEGKKLLKKFKLGG